MVSVMFGLGCKVFRVWSRFTAKLSACGRLVFLMFKVSVTTQTSGHFIGSQHFAQGRLKLVKSRLPVKTGCQKGHI